ncbi:MAG: ribosomal biogenesis protein [Thermosphaera sp.]
MILITTSHRSSQRTRSFVKDLASTIPFALRVIRGKKTLQELITQTYLLKYKWLLIVEEKNGNPSRLKFYHVDLGASRPEGREVGWATIRGVRLSRENPSAVKTSQASTISVDYEGCVRNECFSLADLLLMVFSRTVSSNPDIVLRLRENRGIEVRFYSRHNVEAGPMFRVDKVVINERV